MTEAAAIHRDTHDQHGLAESGRYLGEILFDGGDSEGARLAWLESTEILRKLGDAGAAELAARIDALPSPPSQ